MKKITIKSAKKDELSWINSKYNEVNFVASTFENEYIVIASVDNEKAGIGRLVRINNGHIELGGIYVFPNFRGLGVAENIVKNLCNQNPFLPITIWCLPFEKLSEFYAKFGFKNCSDTKVPEKIATKLEWCNSKSKYDEKVVLLCKTR
ncbi:GNAT family N-acetyltransferase [Cellulophaga baltica]|uniref:GNAT family N-acetyltransferase n=1 Tax=Cellulophaga baltica TaxID=76594 RepID=UPI0015F538AC|nr:GNAT family N-acetyltransferase [Cellulophaga baltica]MBA6315994.1 GNAT family N-acetyltransferase [Cellulophaga baltica]